jgi:mono/diheme cytochrome c family protein
MSQKYFFAAAVALGALLMSLPKMQSQATQQTPAQTSKKQPSDKHKPQPSDNEGQRIFDGQCARCHTAPDGFSPRITNAIVRHMRVRANLSATDEKAILRFMNP